MGASAAPSNKAEARPRPNIHDPASAIPAMDSGIAAPNSRHVIPQDRSPSGRSSFNPAPVSATITTSSVSRSVASGYWTGWNSRNGVSPNAANPASTQNMGKDSGSDA